MKRRTVVSWSSGKDSAWLVHVLRRTEDVELGALLTTVNESAQRVAMHAVRRELLEAQADALGLPLWTVSMDVRPGAHGARPTRKTLFARCRSGRRRRTASNRKI